jgi:chromosome segregation ATPase
MRSIHCLAILLFISALAPAAVLAQSTQPADAAVPSPALASAAERSLPADSLPQLAADYTRASTALDGARQRRTESLGDLQRARDRSRRELMESGEVEEARIAMAQAQDQYLRERDRVIDRLQSNPTYVSNRKKAAEIDAKLAALRQHADVVDEQTTALATQRLHYAAEADQIEQYALERDGACQQARDRYLTAARRHHSAVDETEQRVEADPDVQQARERWQEAREDLQDARTRVATAQAAYVTALDEHREKMHYLQTHSPAEPWDPYGYGYGGSGVVIH